MNSPLRAIMVPLDGSALSQEALSVGMTIAQREHAALHLVTVSPPISTFSGDTGPLADVLPPEIAFREGFRRYLDGQAGACRRRAPSLPVKCFVLEGPVARSLAHHADSYDIDLIVMTTHGWGGLKRFWLGSVADGLIHLAPCPTLVLRPSVGTPAMELHRILIALESESDADALLEPALALGSLTVGTRYTLLQVLQLPPSFMLEELGLQDPVSDGWGQRLAAAAAGRLEHVVQRLRHRGVRAKAQVVVERAASDQILRLARGPGYDLIVVGSRRHGLARALFGSVSAKVVRGARHMVLVVPLEGNESPATSRAGAAARPLAPAVAPEEAEANA